ncbi:MAG: serine hydrolase [Thermoleophilaceae bacterium]
MRSVVVTFLAPHHRRIGGRRLSRSSRALIVPMIRRSDNFTATAIRDFAGNAALRRLGRRVGMRNFATARIWGKTIDRYVVRRHRATAMRLLASIVPTQRWGIAQARPPGWALYFKSGWVPGIENQVSLLRRGNRRVAVAVLTSGLEPAAGRRVEREVARRLPRGLRPDSVPR